MSEILFSLTEGDFKNLFLILSVLSIMAIFGLSFTAYFILWMKRLRKAGRIENKYSIYTYASKEVGE